jgi:hypothetical protein
MSDPPAGDWHGDEKTMGVLTDREKALVMNAKKRAFLVVADTLEDAARMEFPPEATPGKVLQAAADGLRQGVQSA